MSEIGEEFLYFKKEKRKLLEGWEEA